MCRRFDYDNIISLLGAWLLFLLTASLWYWVACICNKIYLDKHSCGCSTLQDFFVPFEELCPSHWWSC